MHNLTSRKTTVFQALAALVAAFVPNRSLKDQVIQAMEQILKTDLTTFDPRPLIPLLKSKVNQAGIAAKSSRLNEVTEYIMAGYRTYVAGLIPNWNYRLKFAEYLVEIDSDFADFELEAIAVNILAVDVSTVREGISEQDRTVFAKDYAKLVWSRNVAHDINRVHQIADHLGVDVGSRPEQSNGRQPTHQHDPARVGNGAASGAHVQV